MANTPFLDLVKPAGTDRALVSVINSNSDKIDGGVSTLSEQKAYQIILGDSDTLATIKTKFDALPITTPISIYATATAMNVLTGGGLTSNSFKGVVVKQNAGNWDFTGLWGSGASGHSLNFRVSSLSSSSAGTFTLKDDIQTLTDKFTPSAYTAPTNIHSNATLTHGGYVRVGNMVVINARFNITSQITGVDTIAKFPSYNMASGQVPLTNNKGIDLGINQLGEMKSPFTVTTGTLVISGTYFVV